VHANELLEGALVSTPGAFCEHDIVGRPALHRPVLHRSGGEGSTDQSFQRKTGIRSRECRSRENP
jgi:hypothetical protein